MKVEENGKIIDLADQKKPKQTIMDTPIYIKNNSIKWFVYSSWDTEEYKHFEKQFNSSDRITDMLNMDIKEKLDLAQDKLCYYLENTYKGKPLTESVDRMVNDVLQILTDIHPFFSYTPYNGYVWYNITFGKSYLEDELLFILHWKVLIKPHLVMASPENYIKEVIRIYYEPVMKAMYTFENEDESEIALDHIVNRYYGIIGNSLSPFESIIYCINWLKTNVSMLVSPIYKKHPSKFNSLLENYVRALPVEIRKIINDISTNSKIDILSRKLINELKKKSKTNKLDADSVVEIFYLLSSKYNDMSNENDKQALIINSFEVLLYFYMKQFSENHNSINFCPFCGRFYIPESYTQKTCHYPKLDKMVKRCDELSSYERYQASLKIPAKEYIRKIQKRLESRGYNSSVWEDARGAFSERVSALLSDNNYNYYDHDLENKLTNLYYEIDESFRNSKKSDK